MLTRINGYLDKARTVRTHSGRSIARQFYDVVGLRFGRHRLSVSEYYDFELYRPEMRAQSENFLGWRAMTPICFGLNDEAFRGLLLDKVSTYRLLENAGLPTPTTVAAFFPSGRTFGGAKILKTHDDVANWLRSEAKFPIYGKSTHGSHGRTNILLRSYDPHTDALNLHSESKVKVDELMKNVTNIRNLGYLFQDVLAASAECAAYFGGRLAGLRIVVLCPPGLEPRVHRAVIKIPSNDNITDNFDHGRTGNLLGAIDVDTGRILRVVQGLGVGDREIEQYPGTDVSLNGLPVPNWAEATEFVLRNCQIFPGLSVQHWDVALTADGPVILEVNYNGDVDLHQIAYGKGYIDAGFETVVNRMGGWGRVSNYKVSRRADAIEEANFEPYRLLGLDDKSQWKQGTS